MNPLEVKHRKVLEKFAELCPDFPALMIGHVVEGWVLAVDIDGWVHYCHAGQLQVELDALADVEPADRGGYLMGAWDGADDMRESIKVDAADLDP